MKKFTILLLMSVLLWAAIPYQSLAETLETPVILERAVTVKKFPGMTEEGNELFPSFQNFPERTVMQNEPVTSHPESRSMENDDGGGGGGGIHISIGAAIIIVVVLIILL